MNAATASPVCPFPSLSLSPSPPPAKLAGHIPRRRRSPVEVPFLLSSAASRSSPFRSQTRQEPPPRSPSASSAASMQMEGQERAGGGEALTTMKLLFVEMGVGYDQHGQDVTKAAMRACRDAITSNSIPAFRRGSIPGVSYGQMKLQIKLGVPQSLQHLLDIERVKSAFPYGEIVSLEVVNGGMICSSGVCLEAMGDKNDDCYVVNAAVYVGY